MGEGCLRFFVLLIFGSWAVVMDMAGWGFDWCLLVGVSHAERLYGGLIMLS